MTRAWLAPSLALALTTTPAPTWAAPPEAPPPEAPPPEASPPDTSLAVPALDAARLRAWRDEGYYDGVGGVLTGWGVAFASAGLTFLVLGAFTAEAESEHDTSFRDFFLLMGAAGTTIGAAQLVPGLILRFGHDAPPASAGAAAERAFDAGSARGAGHVHLGYGAVLALAGFALLERDIGQLMAAAGGAELVWSGMLLYYGHSEMSDVLREARLEDARARPTVPGARTPIVPLVHGAF